MSLILINETSSAVFNGFFFFILIWMIYKIRHIVDDTLVKNECAYVVTVWIFMSICQYILFLQQQADQC